MKFSYVFLIAFLPLILFSCNANYEEEIGLEEVEICLTYTLDTSNGQDMSRGTNSNEEIFNEFYNKIKSGDLLASTYSITFTNIENGSTYTFDGKWTDNAYVTIHTGKYDVTGYSVAEGNGIQEKCSIVFKEQLEITMASSIVTLHGIYDCFLIIFNDKNIQTLQNFDGENKTSFFSFNSYKYAFIKDNLYIPSLKDKACFIGKYTNGTEFKISTGNLNFLKGKYYVYNSINNDFAIPPMEEGNDKITFIANGVSFNMIKVEGGTFNMSGYVSTTISKTYYIGETEVTQKLWNAIMDYNPSSESKDNLPINYITWNDTQKFLSKLNKLLSAEFRLPTEAEWEFACKGGNKSKGYKYSGSDNVNDVAWYESNSSSNLHDVGSKQPNELGLYDMCGNVLEWCYDGYESSLIGGTDPIGVNEFNKVNRGGNAWDYARDNNWRNHSPYGLDAGYQQDGFRLAITIK